MPFKLYSKFIGFSLFHMDNKKEDIIHRIFTINNIFLRDLGNRTAINTICLNQILILIINENVPYYQIQQYIIFT